MAKEDLLRACAFQLERANLEPPPLLAGLVIGPDLSRQFCHDCSRVRSLG
jgi:hypothetical protein